VRVRACVRLREYVCACVRSGMKSCTYVHVRAYIVESPVLFRTRLVFKHILREWMTHWIQLSVSVVLS